MTSFAAVLFDLYATLMRSRQSSYQQQRSTRLGVSGETHLEFLSTGRSVEWYDDTLPVLASLRARGIKTAIASNCDHWMQPVVAAHDLEAKVDVVVFSFEVGAAKPDAAIYRRALERLGVTAAEAVFVDDQPANCAGATAIGLRAYVIDRDTADASRADHHVIHSLGELR